MKRLLSILTSVAFTTSLMANNSIIVNTTQNLVNAVSTVKPGDTILIADLEPTGICDSLSLLTEQATK